MQDQRSVEQAARRRLPALIAELLDRRVDAVAVVDAAADQSYDFELKAGRDAFLVEVKSSSRPGVVDGAARQLARAQHKGTSPLLVVPFMTPAGVRTADEHLLNWLDLSGNAHIRTPRMFIHVEGRPNDFPTPGPTASPFAPKSSRVAHQLLLDPERWWRQVDLVKRLALDDGYVSRVIGRLEDERFLEREGKRFRPRDADLLLDAWADDYRFDRHAIVLGHMTDGGVELARKIDARLNDQGIDHAFTGLPAAWTMNGYTRFRLNTVYVKSDPYSAAEAITLRRNDAGANVQIVGPDDDGVFLGREERDQLPVVSAVQVYLDLQHLPERADEGAEELRRVPGLWAHGG